MNDAAYERQMSAIDTACTLAVRELVAFIGSLNLNHKQAARDALLLYVPVLVDKYSAIAASAAAEYYETTRFEALGEPYRATLADLVDTETIQADVRFACGHLFTKAVDDG